MTNDGAVKAGPLERLDELLHEGHSVGCSEMRLITPIALVLVFFVVAGACADKQPSPVGNKATAGTVRYADYEQLVVETHETSLNLREQALRRTIVRDSCWPGGAWGDTLWALASLQLNEKADKANAQLLRRAQEYIAQEHDDDPVFAPEHSDHTPWAYFPLTDYVRILYLFHGKSPYFPGRLNAETEAAMKEALWLLVSRDSRVADAGLDDLFLLLGTENHDLTRRPNYYLVTALLKEDPAYQNRLLADGHSVSEHAAAYTAFFREWPRSRARSGLWVEVGSNTYQKYSWPALFNLHELAPDPVIRHRFGLLLDLAFVEEAQISVRGRRGGGRSRASGDANVFESYKNLLYAPEGQAAGSSHSRVIESSRYQLPPVAILLRKRAFPASEPFVIRNRVLGELEAHRPDDTEGQRLASDSALVNYAYRTPHYLLGSTLQNPALSMTDPETGDPVLKYAGISRQKRWCGMLFDDSDDEKICAVYPIVEQTRGGRPQHSFWSVQHDNVLLLQRIARRASGHLGSYSTGTLGIRFEGPGLETVEEEGWIFASNGQAFVGVKFLDGGHQWAEVRVEAAPASFTGPGDTSRILLHAGDLSSHGSFARFRETLCSNPLAVTAEKVDYRFGGAGEEHLEMTRYEAESPERFALPCINGNPVDLRPEATYQSPYLNGEFGNDRISVTVGPVRRILDFSEQDD